MSAIQRTHSVSRQQTGIALVVVLILLVVISVLGLAVLRSSSMQERMSANMYDRNLALRASEAALASAQQAIIAAGAENWDEADFTATTCADEGLCPTFTKLEDVTWIAGPTLGDTAGDNVPTTTTEYWIEYLGLNLTHMEAGGVVPGPGGTSTLGPMFRITTRSRGEGRATVILQTDVIHRLERL